MEEENGGLFGQVADVFESIGDKFGEVQDRVERKRKGEAIMLLILGVFLIGALR